MLPIKQLDNKIFTIRGHKVMVDKDLATLYGVSTKTLNQSVKRNLSRFPSDFMFQLTQEEKKEVVTICDHLQELKFSHSLPYAFTELGVAMLSSVLNSETAIQVNIQIMRTFTKLRETFLNYKDLKIKLDEIEKKYDNQFQVVFKAIKLLLEKPKDDNNRRF